jgi:hypothetical protein
MRFARVIEGGSTSKRLRFIGTGGGVGEERGGEAGLDGVGLGVGIGIASQSVVHSDPSCAFVVINYSSVAIWIVYDLGEGVLVPPSFGVRWLLCRHRS